MSDKTALLTRSSDMVIDVYDGYEIRIYAGAYAATPKGSWPGETFHASSLPEIRKIIRRWWSLQLPDRS